MNTVTHALLPVVVTRLCVGAEARVEWKAYAAIALAGAMPDLINPHIYLESRMTSWSHGLPFWLLLTTLLMLSVLASHGKFRLPLAVIMSAAYLLHIACDTISGGVNLLYPVKDLIWGEYWVSLGWWIPIDTVLVIWSYCIFRLIPMRRNLMKG